MERGSRKIILYFVLGIVFLVGFVLRLKTYFFFRPMWHDECSLAMSILSKNLIGYFGILDHAQSAPPVFMGITKISALIFGYGEYALRLVPLLAGLGSMVVFYLLSKKVFKNNFALVTANLLFAINYQLIYYSQEFKQYSTDVFTVLCLILFLSNVNLKEESFKKTLMLGLILSLCPLFSLPSVFIIGGFLVLQLIKERFKNLGKILLILFLGLIVMTIYYIKVLYPSMVLQSIYVSYWEPGFLKLSLNSILYLIKITLDYFFVPNKSVFLIGLLIVGGIVRILKVRKNSQILIIFTLIFSIIASLLRIYPIYERVSLYLVPIFIIFVCLPLENFTKKHIALAIVSLLVFVTGFHSYNLSYFMKFFDKNIFVRKDARSSMEFVKERYKDSDYLLYNKASDSEFYYYTHYFNFVPPKTGVISLPVYNKNLYMRILNSLPANRNYWFYYAYDYAKEPVVEFLKDWSKSQNVIVQKEFNGSFVMYIKNN